MSILPTSAGPSLSPDVAVTPGGETIAVFWADGAIRAAVRPPGGQFSSPVTLSEPTHLTPASSPRVIVDRTGRALVTWTHHPDPGDHDGIVRAAFRSPGARFAAPVTLSRRHAGAPRSVFTSDGRAVVAWEVRGQPEAIISAAGGGFPPGQLGQPVDGGGSAGAAGRPSPAVAADDFGNAYLVWISNYFEADAFRVGVARASRTDPDFADRRELSSQRGASAAEPAVAVAPDGTATVSWGRIPQGPSVDGLTDFEAIQAVNLTPTLSPRGPVQDLQLGFPGSDGPAARATLSGPRVVADAQGNVTAVWTARVADAVLLQGAIRHRGHARFGPVTTIASGAGLSAPLHKLAAASAAGGHTFVSFTRASGTVQTSLFRGGTGFEAPVAISGRGASRGGFVRVGGRWSGDAVAAWSNADGSTKLSVYDTTPPELHDLRTPRRKATVRRRVQFAVSPFDTWTPVNVAWHFGDDTPISAGHAVSHAFARAGVFNVTVAVADAAGNTATATRLVTVEERDRTRPTIRSLSLSRARFAVSPRVTALVAANVARGTTIRYAISEPATLKVYLSRARAGRRSGRRCSTRTRAGRRCTVYRGAGALTRRNRRARTGAITFSGRMGRKALSPGRYRMTVVATDAAGNRSRRRRVSFSIVAR